MKNARMQHPLWVPFDRLNGPSGIPIYRDIMAKTGD